jgi:hypothetical protein
VHFVGVAHNDELSAGQVAAFYLWHFVQLLPFGDVPSTLEWHEPLAYQGVDVGRLVVAFQIVAAVTIIATMRAYWVFLKNASAESAVPEPGANR